MLFLDCAFTFVCRERYLNYSGAACAISLMEASLLNCLYRIRKQPLNDLSANLIWLLFLCVTFKVKITRFYSGLPLNIVVPSISLPTNSIFLMLEQYDLAG
jgi:hypothetical protein